LYKTYLNRFDFIIPENSFEAKSVILVTAPQPPVAVSFQWQGQTYSCIIPPTYSHKTDHQIRGVLERLLKPNGYHLDQKRLPEKLLSVYSGLARYGKNNITYVPGMGSFHRPVVFVSDLPPLEDNWRNLNTMKSCNGCTACMDACPPQAMGSDRFLIHAERCITFHNERPGAFPRWLDSSWHNCLVGCMICQNSCPVNRKLVHRPVDGPNFFEEETAALLQGISREKIPPSAIDKLVELDILEYVDVLGRNLRALLLKP
jgi:epoxyqueuosine reductase